MSMYPPTMAPLAELRRRHASLLINEGTNLFEVAQSFGVSPRVLLAWLDFEGAKWLNDPNEGRGDGPDDGYVGEWPTEEQEFERYMTMGLTAKHFTDKKLYAAYAAHRKKRLSTSPTSGGSNTSKKK